MSNLRWPAYLLVFFGIIAWSVTLVWHPQLDQRFTGLAGARSRIPTTLSGYQSPGEDPTDTTVKAALGTADISSHTYKDDSGQFVNLILIAGTDRNSLHDPRSCLAGAGWRIEDDHTEPLAGTNVSGRVCRIAGGPNGEVFEVIYLYVVDGQVVTQATQIRSQMLLSALIGKRNRPVCFVRFLRPISPNPTVEQANHSRFTAFVGGMWNALQLETTIKED